MKLFHIATVGSNHTELKQGVQFLETMHELPYLHPFLQHNDTIVKIRNLPESEQMQIT